MVLLKGAHDGAARALVELLRDTLGPGGEGPPVRVLFEASALLHVPAGARVVLVQPGPHARWLNLHRPVVRDRRITLLLWCAEGCLVQLKRGAPDFMDWVSHRVFVAPALPRFVGAALGRCEGEGRVMAMLHAPPPPPGWRILAAESSYGLIRKGCQEGPVWVSEVRDALHWLTARIAHAEAGAGHGLVLADPRSVVEDEDVVDALPVPWATAARLLAAAGIPDPGVQAALVDLNPAELGLIREGPLRSRPDPRWGVLLEAARSGPGTEAIELADELDLVEVARAWTDEVAPMVRAVFRLRWRARAAFHEGHPESALGLLARAELAAREAVDPRLQALCWSDVAELRLSLGEAEEALRIRMEEELPLLEALGDARSIARCHGEVAAIFEGRGQHAEALRVRLDEQLPATARAGDRQARAEAWGKVADLHMANGEQEEALRVRLVEQLPILAQLGDLRGRAAVLGKVAEIHVAAGELEEALRIRQGQELPLYEAVDDLRARARTAGEISKIHLARSELDDALRIALEEELPAWERLGDSREIAAVQRRLREIRVARGELPDPRRILYTALAPGPLAADGEADPRQVPGLHPPGSDPVRAILEDLDRAGPQAVELIAGARGAGRHSGLHALARELAHREQVVVRVDIAQTLPASSSLRPEEVHVALVGGIDDALTRTSLAQAVPGPSTWERVARLLPRRLGRQLRWSGEQVRSLLLSGPIGGQRLGLLLAGAGGDLRAALDARFDDLLAAIRRSRGAQARLVVLLEGLDRLGVAPESDHLEAGSVLHLLLSRGQLFALPETHLIALVPAVAAWASPALGREIPCSRLRWWPTPPLRGADGQVDEARVAALMELARRRGEWSALGIEPEELRPLILASGGHLGHLVGMLQDLVLRAAPGLSAAGLVAATRRRREAELVAGLRPEQRVLIERILEGGPLPIGPSGLPPQGICELLHAGALLDILPPGAALPRLVPGPLLGQGAP